MINRELLERAIAEAYAAANAKNDQALPEAPQEAEKPTEEGGEQ